MHTANEHPLCPGEWYFSKITSELSYWPLPGEDDPNQLDIVVPQLDEVLQINGAQHITYRSIAFQFSRFRCNNTQASSLLQFGLLCISLWPTADRFGKMSVPGGQISGSYPDHNYCIFKKFETASYCSRNEMWVTLQLKGSLNAQDQLLTNDQSALKKRFLFFPSAWSHWQLAARA